MARARKPERLTEWVGGIAALPLTLAGPAGPYTADILLWVDTDGLVVDFQLGEASALLDEAALGLRSAFARAVRERSVLPTKLRVESPELAARLRADLQLPPVTCAPTPELALPLEDLVCHITSAPPSFLDGDADPVRMAAFFGASARLHRAKPWRVVPTHDHVLMLDIEALGVRGRIVSVLGQAGDLPGFAVFDDFDAYDDFIEITSRPEHPTRMPRQLVLTFARPKDLAPALLAEVEEYDWELSAKSAIPHPIVIETDLRMHVPFLDDLTVLEATALAIARGCKDGSLLAAPATHRVVTGGGLYDVRLHPLEEDDDASRSKPVAR